MIKNPKLSKFYIRCLIVCFWVGLIFTALFHTKLSKEDVLATKELHVFSWSNVISPELVKAFEKRTGIPVRLDFYSTNEELLVKLKATKGAGYDLIVPSDYAIKLMIEDDLLKPINRSKLSFYNEINPFLLGHDYDPQNTYSIPLQWDVCGFGYDTEILDAPVNGFTWGHLFDTRLLNYKIAMSNDPVEAFCAASYYLYGDRDTLSKKEAEDVKTILTEQKKKTEAYAVPRSDFFVSSKNAVLAMTLSGYALKAKEDFPYIQFVVPNDGTFISIENLAIPKGSDHEKELYQFINFLYEAESQVGPCNQFGGFPATSAGIDLLNYKEDYNSIVKILSKKGYSIIFCRHLISDEEMRIKWVEIKS